MDDYEEQPIELRVAKNKTKSIGSLSDYLLEQSALSDVFVRRNKSAQTNDLKFSDIRHLTLIDEVSIIKELSPVHTTQYSEATKEKSILRYLITGNDDSGLVAKPKKNIVDNRKGRLDVIKELIAFHKEELKEYDYCTKDKELPEASHELEQQIQRLELSVAKRNEYTESLYSQTRELESTIDSNWKEWKENESRLLSVRELLSRAELLNQHYENDVSRLEAIYETSGYFADLEIGTCPTCNHFFNENGHFDCNTEDIENINSASKAEILKIRGLVNELETTVKKLTLEETELNDLIQISKQKHLKYQAEQMESQSNKLKISLHKLEIFKKKLARCKQIKKLIERILDLCKKKSEYEVEINPGEGNYEYVDLSTTMMTDLCCSVKDLLTEWGYGEIDSVSFSESTSDLVINGKDRSLSGKGYRALSYAAFVVGLMQDCIKYKRGHSGIVLLDSPLCTLRSKHIERDSYSANDVIRDETKEKFYEAISKYKGMGQIIILDNDGPLEPKKLNLGFTEFTEDLKKGRYGFFPMNRDQSSIT
ncbi:hypothetical protein TW71_005745 [Vibrio coralliilyticus]|uniref:hypothetical protein n=1 Tax=Vibrio coralliilyticus TaxID=190893 RepID=UPI0012D44FAA|nr:hypothetical protein [Vibrio coralliilyticus]QOU31011.1 hypothetical protein TW71_005745 [Vibrio coralliilyticus]